MSSIYTNEVDYSVLEKVKEDFFNHQNAVIVNDKLEGNNIIDSGQVELGTWSGPLADIGILFHEMGHFVEINEARMNKDGWGLKYGKYRCLHGHSWYESATAQSV